MKTARRLMSMLLSIVMLLSIATVMPFSVSANSNSTTFGLCITAVVGTNLPSNRTQEY